MKPKRTGLFYPLACGLLIIAGSAGAVLSMSFPSWADYQQPPEARPPNAPTDTTGGRDCGVSQNGLHLTPLAPQQHIGQTHSSHPTFMWFVPVETSLKGEFQIYQRTAGERYQRLLAEPYEFESTQGFMAFTLPEEIEDLQPGTDYVWQVLLRCGERPAEIYKVRAQLQVVEITDRLSEPLAIGLLDQANQLAAAGLWYDALALLSPLPVNDEAKGLRSQLLMSLADLEVATEESSDTISHSQALRQIAQSHLE